MPPPDNPLLRHEANRAVRDTDRVTERQLAELRLKAIKQTRRMPSSSSFDTSHKTQTGEP
jgi:hypothetical protein